MALAQVLTTVSGNAALPQLSYAALVAAGTVVPEFEEGPNVYGDWCFDRADSRVLQARTTGPVLTPNAATPTYATGGLTIPSGGLNGLVSALPDAGSKTVVAVVQRPTNPTAVAVIMQTSQVSSGGDDNGFNVYFISTGSLGATLRVSGTDTFMSLATASSQAVGDWAFIAYTETKTGSDYGARLWMGRQAGALTTTAAGVARREATRTVALGNAYDTTTNYSERDVVMHRALMFDRALTVDELGLLYQRARILAGRRGITLI